MLSSPGRLFRKAAKLETRVIILLTNVYTFAQMHAQHNGSPKQELSLCLRGKFPDANKSKLGSCLVIVPRCSQLNLTPLAHNPIYRNSSIELQNIRVGQHAVTFCFDCTSLVMNLFLSRENNSQTNLLLSDNLESNFFLSFRLQ